MDSWLKFWREWKQRYVKFEFHEEQKEKMQKTFKFLPKHGFGVYIYALRESFCWENPSNNTAGCAMQVWRCAEVLLYQLYFFCVNDAILPKKKTWVFDVFEWDQAQLVFNATFKWYVGFQFLLFFMNEKFLLPNFRLKLSKNTCVGLLRLYKTFTIGTFLISPLISSLNFLEMSQPSK